MALWEANTCANLTFHCYLDDVFARTRLELTMTTATESAKEKHSAGAFDALALNERVSMLDVGLLPQGRVVGAKSNKYLCYVAETIMELERFKFALASFVVNNLRRRYRRSLLGFAWSLLNPICMMIVLTVVFGSMFKREMTSYGLYIFSGMLPWTFIQTAVLTGSGSIIGFETFLKRVYIPKAFFPLVSLGTEAFNFVFSLISLFIVAAIVGFKLHVTVLLLPVIIALTFSFAFGLVLNFAIATLYFRDLSHILGVAFQVLFYSTPIIYPIAQLPKSIQAICYFNPIYHFILLFRAVIYEGRFPSALEWFTASLITVATLSVAFLVLKRTEKDLVFRL